MNFEFFVTAMQVALANWQRVVIGGAIVVCSLIVFLGAIKPLIFDKIACKPLRKSLLALTSMALVLPFTAIHFLIDRISFDYYWYACILLAPTVIIVYWLYENTNIRLLIKNLGEKTWNKWLVLFAAGIVEENNEKVKAQALSTSKETKKYIAQELKKASVLAQKNKDEDLDKV